MDLNKRQQDWEDEAPHLAAIGRSNPFIVPDGYFVELPQSIHDKITLEETGLLKATGFSVPPGYFEILSDKIEASIAVEELKDEVNADGFAVPPGYFERLTGHIQQQTLHKEAKIRRLTFSWIGYAAAACITVAIAVTLLFNNFTSIDDKLSTISDQEIENYLALYADQADTQVILENLEAEKAFDHVSNNFSDEELEQYLEDTSL
ncbi:MAG TPA: hypothetical protein VGE26_05795 [Sphingobacteriaceae bacterium]